ncbi:MAG: GNAT family N-acetyltransferase [Bacteroidales bacterium]|nr:GNAT family N-acetyltransferase [Bacteroidales bacterium]
MKPIISPIPKHYLENELTDDLLVRSTSRGGNELYDFNAQEAPYAMKEVGRLREIAFRLAGGGTGEALDIDSYDTHPHMPYRQLVVWNPKHKEILGGYRYIIGTGIKEEHLATSSVFTFADTFIREYLPYTIELGRSFVQPDYQNTNKNRSGLYALDNLWDGLGALIVRHPEMKYFFGKVTMYKNYDKIARNYLLYFLNKYFPDQDSLVTPIGILDYDKEDPLFSGLFENGNYNEDYKLLVKLLKERGERIPPLINSYMRISPNMRVFGTTLNEEFGGVEETGILITIKDMYPERVGRYMNPLTNYSGRLKLKWWRKGSSSYSKV